MLIAAHYTNGTRIESDDFVMFEDEVHIVTGAFAGSSGLYLDLKSESGGYGIFNVAISNVRFLARSSDYKTLYEMSKGGRL